MTNDELSDLIDKVTEDEEYEAVDKFLTHQGSTTFITLEDYSSEDS